MKKIAIENFSAACSDTLSDFSGISCCTFVCRAFFVLKMALIKKLCNLIELFADYMYLLRSY